MENFFALIDQLNSSPEDASHIQQQIWQKYGHQKAVLALDMSGFSLTVRRDGILTYLAKIRKMQQLSKPLVKQFFGEIVKYEADNVLAVFDDCHNALNTALLISQQCQQLDLPVSIGLDYGLILLIHGQDCYGDTVNVAYKLGEDIARANEILITENVAAQLSQPLNYCLQKEQISVSGLEFLAYKIII